MRHYMMPHYKRAAHATLHDATLQTDWSCDTTWCHITKGLRMRHYIMPHYTVHGTW